MQSFIHHPGTLVRSSVCLVGLCFLVCGAQGLPAEFSHCGACGAALLVAQDAHETHER